MQYHIKLYYGRVLVIFYILLSKCIIYYVIASYKKHRFKRKLNKIKNQFKIKLKLKLKLKLRLRQKLN